MTTWLASDLGGKTWGWALGPTPLEYGGGALPTDISDGRLYAMFSEQLVKIINRRKPDRDAVEQPFISYQKQQPMQVRRWMGLLAILHMVVYRMGLPAADEFTPQTIKKKFTGTAHAEKFMIEMECERRGWKPQNTDVADALAVLSCAADMPQSSELKLLMKVSTE